MKTMVGALALFGCAAGTALIKAPVESKCAGYGLKGCGELVEGVVFYLDGDKERATFKLKAGAAKNSPEAIRPFAKVIKDIVPGEDGAAIAEILSGEVEFRASADAVATTDNPYRRDPQAIGTARPQPTASAAPVRSDDDDAEPKAPRSSARLEHVQLAIAAPLDPSRLLTDSVAPQRDSGKTICEVAEEPGVCVRREQGPLVLTDAMVPTACRTEIYIGASDSAGKTAWVIHSNAPGFHGGRYLIRADQRVMVAARGVGLNTNGDDRCFVTWAGFRPRMVPLNMVSDTTTE
jgi:hypothetical protein